ncbi:MAG: M23 family metallopeptidase [Clostridia bacterium]|nr:M23 family metallopeptidase [Clostridia bacterium]
MKEQNEKKEKSKKKRIGGEKRFYLATAIGCAVALIAIVTVAITVSVSDKEQQVNNPNPPISSETDSTGGNGGNNEGDGSGDGEQVVVTPEGMIMPIESVTVLNDYGFYHNQTLNCYYEHTGIDFSAAAGTEVLCAETGTIESIYKDDILLGTEIVVNHGDGIKTYYRFVNEAEGLKVGDTVEKGDVIATVAEANGNEYKDGAHLHFEITENGSIVDPATYLTLEEK